MPSWLFLSVFSILISMGLLMVIMGQYKEMEMIHLKTEELKETTSVVDNKLQYEINFKKSLQDIKTKGEQLLKDVEAALPQLTKQLDDKKSEDGACQEQSKIKNEELASLEETLKSSTATFNTESEGWKQDIINLKNSLTARSPICDHLKTDIKNATLCPIETKSN